METRPAIFTPSRRLSVLLTMGTLVLLIGILYWAREVLMPIALAVLLAFILSPIVNLLRRFSLGLRTAVALTVILAFVLIAGVGMLINSEVRALADALPQYEQNIKGRIVDAQSALKSGPLGKVHHTVQSVVKELKSEEPVEEARPTPVPVVIEGAHSTFDIGIVKTLFGPAVTTGLVVVLVIFILLRHEDLRDRLLQLAGDRRLAVTTKAIDEAGVQVSRYLLRQLVINASFGILTGTMFVLVGMPYAVLLGFLAGAARFIPYLGPVLGAVGPCLMSLAVFEGWSTLAIVAGWYVLLELLISMLIEPLVYGHGTGVSEVALLIMVAFWAWLWGPIGLVLATPLTVCLLVMSKCVPRLEFVSVLLSREPALKEPQLFYHRLIAKAEKEAVEVAAAYARKHSVQEVYEQLYMPALVATRRDYHRHQLEAEDRDVVFKIIRQLVEQGTDPAVEGPVKPVAREPVGVSNQPWVLGFPSRDEADELALLMLARLLEGQSPQVMVTPATRLSTEELAAALAAHPVAVCIVHLPDASTFSARRLCKALRAEAFAGPIVFGCWGVADREKVTRQMAGLPSDYTWTLGETKALLLQPKEGESPNEAGHARAVNRPKLSGGKLLPEPVKVTYI